MTPEERKDARDFSKASKAFGKAGWNEYVKARAASKTHEEAMDLGRMAEAR